MINNSYLSEQTIKKVRGLFLSNREFPSIKLQNFLDKQFYAQLTQEILNSKYKKAVMPMQYSYSVSKTPKTLAKFINSEQLKNYISRIIGKKIKNINGSMHRFEWKDYTLLHDKNTEKEGFDFILDFTDSWDEKADGRIIYTDGKGNYNYMLSLPNTLTIIHRKNGFQKFVQYINHYSNNNKRCLFIGLIE